MVREIIIDDQLIGKLKGLKLNLEFTSGTLDTDIKSLKKAARQGVSEELSKRVTEIMKSKEVSLNDNYKIYWKNNPIAKIKKGINYLSPEIDIIADETIDLDSKKVLYNFLSTWLKNHISQELYDLINLTKSKNKNRYIRALSFRLYENNGILKRNDVKDIVAAIPKEDRKQFRNLGIKIGRYHIFLPKMLKPKAVYLRILLWKFYNNVLSKQHN